MVEVEQIQNPACRACRLPPRQRQALDRELLRKVPISELTQKYGLSKDILYRHRKHLAPVLASQVQKVDQNHAAILLQDMTDLMQTSKDILKDSLADGSRSLSLKAIKEVRNNIEVLGKVVFSMNQSNTQGLDPAEIAEFREWKKQKASFGDEIRALSPEDQALLKEFSYAKIERMGNASYKEESTKVAQSPTSGVDSPILTVSMQPNEEIEANPDSDNALIIDNEDCSLSEPIKPRKPRKEEDPAPRMKRTT